MTTQLPEFDELVKLAQQNPEKLEQIRQELIQSTIEDAPSGLKDRLMGLQFTIDMEIRRSKNPLDSCLKLSSMMHDSFARLRTALGKEGPDFEPNVEATADVICFESAKPKQA